MPGSGSAIRERSEYRTRRPSKYNVIILNDDFTPMDFVTQALESIFRLSRTESVAIMLDIHKRGKGVLGPYSYDLAKTRCRRLMESARAEGFPLRADVEKA
ncbi:MAG: ATP-dependent Clp protease adaptor ClpS [Muribaculaceae bacterium]|nr:ATP-dependent Clp protease adaptor ClpS [Muribaculaceae bacterium]